MAIAVVVDISVQNTAEIKIKTCIFRWCLCNVGLISISLSSSLTSRTQILNSGKHFHFRERTFWIRVPPLRDDTRLFLLRQSIIRILVSKAAPVA